MDNGRLLYHTKVKWKKSLPVDRKSLSPGFHRVSSGNRLETGLKRWQKYYFRDLWFRLYEVLCDSDFEGSSSPTITGGASESTRRFICKAYRHYFGTTLSNTCITSPTSVYTTENPAKLTVMIFFHFYFCCKQSWQTNERDADASMRNKKKIWRCHAMMRPVYFSIVYQSTSK